MGDSGFNAVGLLVILAITYTFYKHQQNKRAQRRAAQQRQLAAAAGQPASQQSAAVTPITFLGEKIIFLQGFP
uniref:Uncharacterized protein n=1 Tax=Romanomermis culicivorax TaxID=13658 RepID=A0A915KHI1_ROMCU